ncbi:MAG: calcium/sodium antiporter [Geminicoccaceae bacterium]
MIWQVVIGLALMLAGGEGLVRGAVAVAARLGVSPLVIGVTLIGFGTSAPELATCIDAALIGAPGLAVGNVIGSSIANVLLILAAGALIHPIASQPRALRRDGPVLVVSALICAAVVMSGHIGRWLGAALLLGLIGYLILTTLDDRRRTEGKGGAEDAGNEKSPNTLPFDLALVVIGLGAVLFGADLLVKGAIDLAGRLGVSDALIGLTLVAVGTSLPELSTAIIASLKRQGEIAFGNVIGSNIFNVLGIFGATALVKPIDVPAEVVGIDIFVMLGATAALLVFAVTNWRISRREGAVLLIGYIAYLGLRAGAVGA